MKAFANISLIFNNLVDGLVNTEVEMDSNIYTGENKSSTEEK